MSATLTAPRSKKGESEKFWSDTKFSCWKGPVFVVEYLDTLRYVLVPAAYHEFEHYCVAVLALYPVRRALPTGRAMLFLDEDV